MAKGIVLAPLLVAGELGSALEEGALGAVEILERLVQHLAVHRLEPGSCSLSLPSGELLAQVGAGEVRLSPTNLRSARTNFADPGHCARAEASPHQEP